MPDVGLLVLEVSGRAFALAALDSAATAGQDPALQRPVANFVRQEREQVEHQIEAMRVHDNPYRKAEI